QHVERVVGGSIRHHDDLTFAGGEVEAQEIVEPCRETGPFVPRRNDDGHSPLRIADFGLRILPIDGPTGVIVRWLLDWLPGRPRRIRSASQSGIQSAIHSAIRNPQSAMAGSPPCPGLEYQRIPDVDIR